MDAAFVDDFRRTIDRAAEQLLAFDDARAAEPRAPGKWSRKEIIGHLIDSAANNHARFVRAQLQDDLVFDGYEQAEWVEIERYRDRPWAAIVSLWKAYNEHIAHVMASADRDAVERPRTRHNLDRLAWQEVPATQPTTLGYFMRDYVGHLKHHLRQALGDDFERS